MILAIVFAYVAVSLFAARKAFYAFRADDTMAPDDRDRTDAAMLGFLSLLVGLFWPLALPVAIVMWKPRKTPAELQQEIDKRDVRIAELEREAGIRP